MTQGQLDPLSQSQLERLIDTAAPYAGTSVRVSLKADCVLRLTTELVSLREEIFRIYVCDTVDRMIALEDQNEFDLLIATGDVRRNLRHTCVERKFSIAPTPIPYVEEFFPY